MTQCSDALREIMTRTLMSDLCAQKRGVGFGDLLSYRW
eukprot:SAG31_NODE_1528_length_8003_cov_1.749620_2_plen_38_part_00